MLGYLPVEPLPMAQGFLFPGTPGLLLIPNLASTPTTPPPLSWHWASLLSEFLASGPFWETPMTGTVRAAAAGTRGLCFLWFAEEARKSCLGEGLQHVGQSACRLLGTPFKLAFSNSDLGHRQDVWCCRTGQERKGCSSGHR